MATFSVSVVTLDDVRPHPNADRLELGVVGGFCVVIAKGQYRAGEKVVYIPEGAVLPPELIERLGLVGKLAGSAKNRVKAVRLRGELSQGLLVSPDAAWELGDNVAEALGVTKYEPPIPPALAGEVYVLDIDEVISFDLDDIKRYPGVIAEGELVTMTEKIHGTFTMVGARPSRDTRESDGHREGRSFVSSKGLMHKRLGFKHNEANAHNTYLRTAHDHGIYAVVESLADRWGENAFILGETFGVGLQDLVYGTSHGKPDFRVFVIVRGKRFLNDAEIEELCAEFGLKRVPVLYRGPFTPEALHTHTSGQESVTGQAVHLREGVVVTPCQERYDSKIGRVSLKSVSEAYLDRKGGTEFN